MEIVKNTIENTISLEEMNEIKSGYVTEIEPALLSVKPQHLRPAMTKSKEYAMLYKSIEIKGQFRPVEIYFETVSVEAESVTEQRYVVYLHNGQQRTSVCQSLGRKVKVAVIEKPENILSSQLTDNISVKMTKSEITSALKAGLKEGITLSDLSTQYGISVENCITYLKIDTIPDLKENFDKGNISLVNANMLLKEKPFLTKNNLWDVFLAKAVTSDSKSFVEAIGKEKEAIRSQKEILSLNESGVKEFKAPEYKEKEPTFSQDRFNIYKEKFLIWRKDLSSGIPLDEIEQIQYDLLADVLQVNSEDIESHKKAFEEKVAKAKEAFDKKNAQK